MNRTVQDLVGLDMFQPNPGWGNLCDTCKHRGDLATDASFPCRKTTLYAPMPHPQHGDVLMTDLKRWANGTETCSDHEANASGHGRGLPCTVDPVVGNSEGVE